MSTIFVTGGAGFIGSHVCKSLVARGHLPVVFDNLSTGNADAVQWGPFCKGDVRDSAALRVALETHRPEAIIHFAASAYVGDSIFDPSGYYSNNVHGMQTLLDCAVATGVRKLVFSSSCATYGVPEQLPISETTRQSPINPYGRTKLVCEFMLEDFARAYGVDFVILRYFNASGADLDGALVERHNPETHLIPRALMAAYGIIDRLDVFGNDFPTPDGTCVRDYIHVADLADGHIKALDFLKDGRKNDHFNLGTGEGRSNLEIIRGIERVTGRKLPYAMLPRREGDPPALVANVAKAACALNFTARYSDLDTIVATAAASIRKVHSIA